MLMQLDVALLQPLLSSKELEIELDSDAESDDDEDYDDEDDDPFSNRRKDDNNEHSNPHSYSWCIMRHACIIIAQQNLERFLTVAGIELTGESFGANQELYSISGVHTGAGSLYIL